MDGYMTAQEKDLDRFLTPKEAGKFMGLAPGTLLNMANRGEIPFYRMKGRKNGKRFKKEDLEGMFVRVDPNINPEIAL